MELKPLPKDSNCIPLTISRKAKHCEFTSNLTGTYAALSNCDLYSSYRWCYDARSGAGFHNVVKCPFELLVLQRRITRDSGQIEINIGRGRAPYIQCNRGFIWSAIYGVGNAMGDDPYTYG